MNATSRTRLAAWTLGTLLSAALWPLGSFAFAFANVDVGQAVENEELPGLDGGKKPLLQKGKVGVFVFFRPNQDHSRDTLQRLAEIEKEFAAKPVSFAAVVSDSWPADEVRALVRQVGLRMPVLVDRTDALYGKLGVRLHPVIGITDRSWTLVAYQPFAKVNYGEVIRAQIRRALGEIGEAELAKVLDPPRAGMPGDDPRFVAKRDVNLGKVFLEKRNWEKALELARKGQERDPTSAGAHTLAGQALAGMGRCAEAVREFETALKLDPKETAAAEGKKACGR
ncbi:MAG TPA: redoxin domain-containing protein [Anaeromyxobacteraceae bacterium]|nr:redoxin domain-containing protein [Anaeromyxobacteraceae bacterium]